MTLINENTTKLLHEDITQAIIGCSFEVMRELGVGFLESVYKNALIIALRQKGFSVEKEVPYEIVFRGVKIGQFFADIVVNGKVVIEAKCCKLLLPEHYSQVINYLKASTLKVGLLVNFGSYELEIKRLYG